MWLVNAFCQDKCTALSSHPKLKLCVHHEDYHSLTHMLINFLVSKWFRYAVLSTHGSVISSGQNNTVTYCSSCLSCRMVIPCMLIQGVMCRKSVWSVTFLLHNISFADLIEIRNLHWELHCESQRFSSRRSKGARLVSVLDCMVSCCQKLQFLYYRHWNMVTH